jgi:iron(III) transport system permease protein
MATVLDENIKDELGGMPLESENVPPRRWRSRPVPMFIMAVMIIVLGLYLIYPIILLLILSFNTSADVVVGAPEWGFSNWTDALSRPGLLRSIWNSFMIWFLVILISFPVAIAISLTLARTNIPFSRGLEFMFWIAFIFPTLASTLGWIMLLSPNWGFLNKAIELLPFVDKSPFNIYSVAGIVWARLMADGIAFKVILLTPAFRNMDGALEEASRVSGSSKLRTIIRVTLPVMIGPIVLVLALQLLRMFQGFEVEWLLGAREGFFVYSTLIYSEIALRDVPQYGFAVVLASVTLLIIALIIPFQRWILGRRSAATVSSSFRPSLLDLGRWRWIAFSGILGLNLILTVVPAGVLLAGSFMARVGFFNTIPLWTTRHWENVFTDEPFLQAVQTTLILSVTTGIISPILFSMVAYLIVRTRLRGRAFLDGIIWAAAAMPGILLGLGLLLMFLTTPGLRGLFGTIWVLILVAVLHGATTSTNVLKGVLAQLGASLEEAGRVSGGSWLRTYFRVVVPVLMPTMVLVGTLAFVYAAGMTSSIILLASRQTKTMSILALEYSYSPSGSLEQAGIISLLVMVLSLGVALPIRTLALKMGVRHDLKVDDAGQAL